MFSQSSDVLEALDNASLFEKRVGILVSFAVYQFENLLACGEFSEYYTINIHTGECVFSDSAKRNSNTINLKIKGDPYSISESDLLDCITDGLYKLIQKKSN